MFADQAVIVNSNDKRYERFINKNVINPVNKQILKVIGDDYVDMEFASGVMKCTPGHDFNDYELAVKHQLKMPLIMYQSYLSLFEFYIQINIKHQKLQQI